MIKKSKIIFLIEKLQPNLLKSKKEKVIYKLITCILSGLTIGIITAIFCGWIIGLVFGLIGGSISLISQKIILFEGIRLSEPKNTFYTTLELLRGTAIGFPSGSIVFFGLAISTGLGLTQGLKLGLFVGLLIAMIVAIIFGIDSLFTSNKINKKTKTNQGIWSSRNNFVLIGIFCFIIIVLIGFIVGIFDKSIKEISLQAGIIFGLIFGLRNGGLTCIQHLSLRKILSCNSYVPWNYARFLDYATDRLLMKKVGGGYVFYPRMLMEHFAHLTNE